LNRFDKGARGLLVKSETASTVGRVQVTDGFFRLLVSSELETTTVDLAWDARRFPLDRTEDVLNAYAR